jgi:hypothetical protein
MEYTCISVCSLQLYNSLFSLLINFSFYLSLTKLSTKVGSMVEFFNMMTKSVSTKAGNFLPACTSPRKSRSVELVNGTVKLLQFGPVFILQGRRDERTIKAK